MANQNSTLYDTIVLCVSPTLEITYNISSVFDYRSSIENCDEIFYSAGGKGVNVSRILNQLYIPNLLLGFIGGEIGKFIIKILKQEGLVFHFINTHHETRSSIVLNYLNNQQRIIRKTSNTLSHNLYEKLIALINKNISTQTKLLVLSGSLPKDFGILLFENLRMLESEFHLRLIIDCADIKLPDLKRINPFLFTPNLQEAENMLNITAYSKKEKINLVSQLNIASRNNVILTLGANGALAIIEDKLYEVKTHHPKIVNSIGAGDALVAGLVFADKENSNIDVYLRKAFSVAIASLGLPYSGSIDLAQLNSLNQYSTDISIKKL